MKLDPFPSSTESKELWNTRYIIIKNLPIFISEKLWSKQWITGSGFHFFQDIRNSFHGVTQIGLKPHQNFFQIFFSTNMVARGVQSFCILEGATDPLIEQLLKFFCQFTPDIWWANAENFKSISWVVSDLLPFNWKILAVVRLLS